VGGRKARRVFLRSKRIKTKRTPTLKRGYQGKGHDEFEKSTSDQWGKERKKNFIKGKTSIGGGIVTGPGAVPREWGGEGK